MILKKILNIAFYLFSSFLGFTASNSDSLAMYYYGLAEKNHSQFDKYIFYAKKALPRLKDGNLTRFYFRTLTGLVNVNYYISDYEQSQSYAAKMEKELIGQQSNSGTVYINLNRLGIYHYRNGNYKKAKKLFSFAKNKWKVNGLKNTIKLNQGEVLNNLGLIAGETGDIYEAINYYEIALEQFKQFEDKNNLQIGIVYYNISRFYEALRDYQTAQFYLEKSLQTHLKKPLDLLNKRYYAGTLIKYGEILQKQNQLSKAEKYFKKTLQLPKLRGDYYARATRWLSINHLKNGNLIEAKQQLNTALEQHLHFFKKKHYKTAKTYSAIADYYQLIQDDEQALRYLQQAIYSLVHLFNDSTNIQKNPIVDKNIIAPTELLSVLRKKSELLHKIGKHTLALETYKLQSELIYYIRKDYHSTESKYFLSENATPILEQSIDLANDLYLSTKNKKIIEKIFYFFEVNKSILLLESISTAKAKGMSILNDSLIIKQEQLKSDLAFYQRILLEHSKDSKKQVTADSNVFLIKQQIIELNEFIKDQFPNYYQIAQKTNLNTISDLQQQFLSNHQSIIEYFYGDSTIYTITITKKDFQISQIPKADISNKITTFRSILNTPNTNKNALLQFQNQGQKLYQLLLQEPLNNLSPQITELIIIRDGNLSEIPFEILLTNEEKQSNTWAEIPYLQNKYTISYAQSATMLMHNLKKELNNTPKKFLGFAPLFQGSRSLLANRSCNIDSLSQLEFNQEEITNIAKIIGGNAINGANATKSNFLAQTNNAKILHLATHACIDDQNPAQSRLYFTDDYFYLHELYNLDLSADMVVLSACETGIGEYQRGEGMMSLAHGFAYAGVPSTTMSLWSVNDQATSELMQGYYRHLKAGKTKHHALRQAKFDYLQNQESIERLHPFYWAGFVHVGDYRALEFSTDSNYYWWVGIIGFLIITFFLHSIIKMRQHRPPLLQS